LDHKVSQPVREGVDLKSTWQVLRGSRVETLEDSVLDWQTRKPHLESCWQLESFPKIIALGKTEKRTPVIVRMVGDHGFQKREFRDRHDVTRP
jgi:hypothetical protein